MALETAGDIGLSMSLYRVIRDDQTQNQPPRRIAPNLIRRQPLPAIIRIEKDEAK
jgi:hypothetical protein